SGGDPGRDRGPVGERGVTKLAVQALQLAPSAPLRGRGTTQPARALPRQGGRVRKDREVAHTRGLIEPEEPQRQIDGRAAPFAGVVAGRQSIADPEPTGVVLDAG